MHANKSLYQYHMWVSGIFFGAGHLVLASTETFTIRDTSDWAFYLASFIILGVTFGAKIRKKSDNDKLYELARSHAHILADFCCAVGSVSVFAMLSYGIISNKFENLSLTNLPTVVIILGVNVGIFSLGYYILRLIAKDERNRNSENEQAAPTKKPTAKPK